MSTDLLSAFAHVRLIDVEFRQRDGELPEPICMVIRDWRTNENTRIWQGELFLLDRCPFPTDANTLYVAYYASAELASFLQLGWQLPERVLDLYAEFRCLTSGLPVPSGYGLFGALAYSGIDGFDTVEKAAMRNLAMRGGAYNEADRDALSERIAV